MSSAPTATPTTTTREAAAREQILVGIIADAENASAYLILSDIGNDPWVLTEAERQAIRDVVVNVMAAANHSELSAVPTWRTDFCAYLGRDGFNQQQLADDIVIALIAKGLDRFDFSHCMCESSPNRDCQQMRGRLTEALKA